MKIGRRDDFDLNEMAIFVRVVESGSFTGAAKALGLPKSTVSRKMTMLEERLGVRLIQRTTRSLRLTDTGTAYFNQCSQILSDIEAANDAVTDMQAVPTGTLRITAPVIFGSTVLSELVAKYMEQHPQIKVDMVLTDSTIDLIQEGIDVAFRIGFLEDSSLIGRHLGNISPILCASPTYLETKGEPNHPEDLSEHDVLTYGSKPWILKHKSEGEFTTNFTAKVTVNDFQSLSNLAISGTGITLLPAIQAMNFIREGKLKPVLCCWQFEPRPIHALYASNRHLSAKMRSFIDFIIEEVRPTPPWEISDDGHLYCPENAEAECPAS